MNQYLSNIEVQRCKCCVNIAKFRLNVEKTLQKRLISVKSKTASQFNINSTQIQHLFNLQAM